MEEYDPVNGWPQRAISLWEMMMMMIEKTQFGKKKRRFLYNTTLMHRIYLCISQRILIFFE